MVEELKSDSHTPDMATPNISEEAKSVQISFDCNTSF